MRIVLIRHLLILSLLFTDTGILKAKPDYKKWLKEEVTWIISEQEVDRFQLLKSDEARERFIQDFWERRDPTPSTQRNEFKEEHYRRFEYALRNFQEGIPGWRTDRGRIYILHGAPAKEYFLPSVSHLNLDRRTNPRIRAPNTIVWAYRSNPNARYYRGEIHVVFQPSTGITRQTFALSESKTAQDKADQINRQFGPASDQNWLEADVRYSLIFAGPPALISGRGAELPNAGMGEAVQYVEDLLRSPGDVMEENLRKTDERERAKQQIREAVAARLTFGNLPISLLNRNYLQPDGNYQVQFQIEIPASELAALLNESDSKPRIDVYCALTDGRGTVVDEFIDSADLFPNRIKAELSDKVHYYNTFSAAPGKYFLKAAVRKSESERLGYCEVPVILDARDEKTFRVSDLLITNQILATDGDGGNHDLQATSVILGDTRFVPHPGNRYSASDTLFVYFQIFLPEGMILEARELSVGMNFICEDRIVSRIEPRKLLESNCSIPGVVNYATAVSLMNFPNGLYTIQVQVIDHTARRFAIQRGSFLVHE